MLFKRDVVEKISRNPLPAEIRKRSDLIKGLYYFYGIGCREDEWLAEIFWQGRIIAAEMPGTESDIADYPLWSPERIFRTAMLYGPDTAGLQEGLSADLPGDMTRLGIQWLKSQEKYFQIESEISEPDLRRAYCQSYLEDLPYYVWEGFDYQDPRPELVLHQADEIYDTGSDEDWRENVESCRGICYSAGSCFGLYKAAEKLYRLAAIGGNLRAIETDVAEIEYYSDYEFEDEIWDAVAGAVREAEQRADSLQTQGNLKEAVRWWRKSAAGGNPSGMRGLISALETWEEAPGRNGRLDYWRKRLSECYC